ncbi:hypothetical protein A6U86_23065 [Rhizobium sp. AC27/96]|uniref:hypothetical protein n=1 Tax=Rhizobium sp. AC27/96 TaxID=1841653 RepID=UPI000827B29C|nr:hypothetical protein [Rhizobium sp. AC27/96]OCJ11350.1 hypothetical protein A6U86_23065 [Rhizobium sp. AC27/96]
MAIPHSFDGALDKAHATLDDAIGSAGAAVAMLGGHARGEGFDTVNFPVEEALVRETIELLDRWKLLALSLVKELDRITAQADLQHRRLFDEKAGLENAGLLRRKLAGGPTKPEAIIADLDAALNASATLDLQLKQARPAFAECFHECELQLEGVIERRQKLDFEIEEVQRAADAMTARIIDHRRSLPSIRQADMHAELDEDYRVLLAEQDEIRKQERELQAGRTVRQRLIDMYEGLAGVLNAQIAAVGAMAGKLTIDIEQRIALLKALEPEADPPSLAAARPEAVQGLIEAFEANVLAGHDLAARKAHVDRVFTRRLEPHLLPVSAAVGGISGDAQPEE